MQRILPPVLVAGLLRAATGCATSPGFANTVRRGETARADPVETGEVMVVIQAADQVAQVGDSVRVLRRSDGGVRVVLQSGMLQLLKTSILGGPMTGVLPQRRLHRGAGLRRCGPETGRLRSARRDDGVRTG